MTTTTHRDYTAELRAAAQTGQIIVCSLPPYEGHPVAYAPRGVGDPTPWTCEATLYAMAGHECHAVPGTPVLQRAATRPDDCSCAWVYNTPLRAWDRHTRSTFCPLHAAHDHWAQQCPADTEGPWVIWLCEQAIADRAITPTEY